MYVREGYGEKNHEIVRDLEMPSSLKIRHIPIAPGTPGEERLTVGVLTARIPALCHVNFVN